MTRSRGDDSLATALSDARYALRVMADLRLPMRDWTAVEAATESMLEALASGDAEGFETALEELSVVMPPRSWSASCHTATTAGERLSSRFVDSSHSVTSVRS